jgi:catechol 2,3-dioxygenase-like lactoylglutathione lyase family enzyme
VKLDHINIRTDDLDGVKDSLIRLLCLEVGRRPPSSIPGYWLYGAGYPIVHLTERNSDPGNSTGALDHIAFKDNDFDALIVRLEEGGIEYDSKTNRGTGVRQVFFKINHDIRVEVDFDPTNETN